MLFYNMKQIKQHPRHTNIALYTFSSSRSKHQSSLDSCTEVEHKPWKLRKYDPHFGHVAILVRSTWKQFKSKWYMLPSGQRKHLWLWLLWPDISRQLLYELSLEWGHLPGYGNCFQWEIITLIRDRDTLNIITSRFFPFNAFYHLK